MPLHPIRALRNGEKTQMKHIITVQHTQSVHHTNGMVGSWTDWDLTELGKEQACNIGRKLKEELAGEKVIIFSSDLKRRKKSRKVLRQIRTVAS